MRYAISSSVKARAKAIRSGNSLKLEVQWTSNASFISERVIRASANCASVRKSPNRDTCAEKGVHISVNIRLFLIGGVGFLRFMSNMSFNQTYKSRDKR